MEGGRKGLRWDEEAYLVIGLKRKLVLKALALALEENA